ncbi:MAG TPA: dihydroxyacetone kinase subunit DhaL [Candidatus Acidoferrum sp.]|nr:dihydroxyacetone kinase subunit DhaL [Candidatus Acidoferrum sp.]
MRTAISSADVLAVLQQMADDLEAAKDFLCQLDAAVGDGDQGVTMAIGFRAVRNGLPALQGQDIGSIITKSGLTFNGNAASTIGALLATACMRAGRAVKGRQEIGPAELARMAEAAQAGIQERGKAQLGDKTVLDMLAPTVQALRDAADQGASLEEALRRSLAAAEEGVKATIPLKSKIGRAAWLADRTVGHQDPGATSFYLMWKSAVGYLTGV